MQPLERPLPISHMHCMYALYVLSTVHPLLNGRRQQLTAAVVVAMLWYVFVHKFLFNPHFDLEPDYMIRKPIIHKILRYIPRMEILSTFHTWVDNRSICRFCIVFTPKLPLPLQRSPPKSNTPKMSPTPLTTPNGIWIQSAVSPQFTCADGQMGGATWSIPIVLCSLCW